VVVGYLGVRTEIRLGRWRSMAAMDIHERLAIWLNNGRMPNSGARFG
jgi:hypothetical protein